ncbi:MAG: ABC transporter ATP-binding protein/permease [Spirochaetaceae bacterium]|nr:ABC transporter ATP-binding protein/permease [Spirochaetaceae bacterium]
MLRNILNALNGYYSPETMFLLMIYSGGVFAASALQIISQKLAMYVTSIHDEMLQHQVSSSILRKAMQADIKLYDSPKYYDLLNSARDNSFAVSNILWSALDCISSLLSFTGAFVVLCQVNAVYAVLITLISIPSAFVSNKYTKLLYQNSLKQMTNSRQRFYIFSICSSKDYAQDIRHLKLEDLLLEKYNILWKHIFLSKKNILKKNSLAVCLLSLLPEALIIIISLQIARKVLLASMTIGDYPFYIGLFQQVYGSIMLLTNYLVSVYDNKLKIESMSKFDVLSLNKIESGAKNIAEINSVVFKNVSFSYPETSVKVLNNISFSVKSNEKIAFVGKNGSGKSTIVKLLLRLYDVNKGEILINGLNIKNYRLDELQKCFGVYFQNGVNFAFTLRENIDPKARDDYSDKEKKEVLNFCAGSDILKICNEDLGAYLSRSFSESGVELSQGQRQKLALARALYTDASALILDEPSSSLDPEAEEKVFSYLKRRCENKTVFFISHRLSNIHLADRIIVIENGTVAEQGTQKDLLKKSSRYAELYNFQAGRFKEVL